MKFVGWILTTFVVFCVVWFLWYGLPETIDVKLFHLLISAAIYSVLATVIDLPGIFILCTFGALIGGMFAAMMKKDTKDGIEIGGLLGLISAVPVLYILNGFLLYFLGRWLEWFIVFTFWQIVVILILKLAIGITSGNYNSLKSKTKAVE